MVYLSLPFQYILINFVMNLKREKLFLREIFQIKFEGQVKIQK